MCVSRIFLICASALLLLSSCSSGDRPDPKFDTRVADPAYPGEGPRVLFDEAHHNVHTARGKYRPFVKLLEADGYSVSRGRRTFTAASLETFDVLVIANALGTNERNDDPAFTEDECDAVRDWVAEGGALLFMTDHYPTGPAASPLATRFGVRMSNGVVEDSLRFDATFEPTHLVFSREDGGLGDHPILEGGGATERINRVLTFTGQALAADPPAVSLLVLSASAALRPAHPRVEHRGRDVLVHVEYGDPEPAAGMSQGIALEFGSGRVVVFGEAAMLTAQLARFDGRRLGMNVVGYDNRQLALNVMHWLTKAPSLRERL